MSNNLTFNEALVFCTGAQENKDVAGWRTLKEYESVISNPSFDAKVYQQGNDIVIAYAGTNTSDFSGDGVDDLAILVHQMPKQYNDAQVLYDTVKDQNPNANIKLTGYSLGGTLSNMVSSRTGVPSTSIAPIGGKDMVSNNEDYFKHGDSNVVTYGRPGDWAFGKQLNDQLGTVKLLPNLNKLNPAEQHYLHLFKPNEADMAVEWNKKPTLRDRSVEFQNAWNNNVTAPFKQNMQQVFGNRTDFAPDVPNYGEMHQLPQMSPVYPMSPVSNIFAPAEGQGVKMQEYSYPDYNSEEFKRKREDILNQVGKMPLDELKAREAEIMSILRPLIPDDYKYKLYEQYANFSNNKGRIITLEDIECMSPTEFNKNYEEIRYQMDNVGMPSEKDLPSSVMTYKKQTGYEDYSKKKGRWVTIDGNRVFIEK